MAQVTLRSRHGTWMAISREGRKGFGLVNSFHKCLYDTQAAVHPRWQELTESSRAGWARTVGKRDLQTRGGAFRCSRATSPGRQAALERTKAQPMLHTGLRAFKPAYECRSDHDAPGLRRRHAAWHLPSINPACSVSVSATMSTSSNSCRSRPLSVYVGLFRNGLASVKKQYLHLQHVGGPPRSAPRPNPH